MEHKKNVIEVKDIDTMCKRAFLIGIKRKHESLEEAQYHLEELEGLVQTMGIPVVGSELVSLRAEHPKYLLGSGKVEDMLMLSKTFEADVIIFDDELSPAQQRNWEKLEENMLVIDRQEVILDIFAMRAHTREARLQVALARMEYSLPRLTRAWSHLSRQKGGTKGTRGEGETQLEVDKRLALTKIAKLKKEIATVKKQRDTQRKKRQSRPVPLVSIVGYTNAGKSSLLNTLTRAEVLTENKLFATLDTTTKKIKLDNNMEILLSDTVGFIRKLPHNFIDAFKSTLEETILADLLIHLVDIHSFEREQHIHTSNEVLRELNGNNKDVILVFNKQDLFSEDALIQEKNALIQKYSDTYGDNICFISTHKKTGIDALRKKIAQKIAQKFDEVCFSIPHDRGDIVSVLYKESCIIEEIYDEKIYIKALVNKKTNGSLQAFIVK